MAREDQRQCKKCEYAWYAVKVKPTGKTSWTDTQTNPFLPSSDAAAKVARKQGRRNESISAYERWAICPRCGSQKVRTVVLGHFAPTGLTESRNAAAPTPTPSAPPAWTPPPPATAPASTPGSTLAIGTRVTLQILGFRGKTGTVSGYGEKGYTVKVDGGGTARWVPASKLTPIAR